MTAQEITKYSEIMARFEGWSNEGFPNNGDIIWTHPEVSTRLTDKVIIPRSLRNMHFHTDYNWLHRVWVKFRDLKFEEVDQLKEFKLHKDQISYAIAYWSPEEAFLELGKAIEWYQNLKP